MGLNNKSVLYGYLNFLILKTERIQKDNKQSQVLSQLSPNFLQNGTENAEDNFEEELSWCIQQIEIGLRIHKPSQDQGLSVRNIKS